MTDRQSPISRRDSILQALAHMLETEVGKRITTAELARVVGVSEAALYRQFPSKAKMYEALIEFVEETLFSRINVIIHEEQSAIVRCGKILQLFITFASKNPGLCRLITGDALTGEKQLLRNRTVQVFDRLETQLKQLLRTGEIEEHLRFKQPINATANLLVAALIGRMMQYVQSGFKRLPTAQWEDQWTLLAESMVIQGEAREPLAQ